MSRADDDYDDRPRRRRPRDDDDDYDDRPRRGKASGGGGGGKALIIIGVVVAGLFCLCLPVAIGVLLPAVQKVREAAARAHDTNNLRRVGVAFHTHLDATGRLPAADGDLSWRVHLLSYLEQDAVYRQFDLDRKWDDPRNRPLADTRVPQYVSPLDDSASAQTRVRVFIGPDTMFPPGEPPVSLREVKDGSSNTILAVEAADPVPWPQPWELVYARGGPLPPLGHPHRPAGFLMLVTDGSVRFTPKGVSERSLRAGITPAAGDGPPDF
jgi:hypothetical protein